MSDVASTSHPSSVDDDQRTIDRLTRQIQALQTKVQRLEQREQTRQGRAEQRRDRRARARTEAAAAAAAANAVTPVALPPRLVRIPAANLAERTRQLTEPAELYLDLLKNQLTRLAFGEASTVDAITGQPMAFDAQRRTAGSDFPAEAETMAGLLRLDNVQQCIRDVLQHNVPGDLVETGVWRGGMTILMRAVLRAYGDRERTVWVADSFAGLPTPDPERYTADTGYDLSVAQGFDYLAVSLDEVQANFARYGLLDAQVRFLVGWFKDTLPTAPIDQIAVLRLDGDLYESTMVALDALYPKLSVGGYLIVDDYLSWEPCQQAVDDFRAAHGIAEPIQEIDWTGVYWQRAG